MIVGGPDTPFVFDHRTGELTRNHSVIALCRLHAQIFACLAEAQGPIGRGAISRAIGVPTSSVDNEMPALARRLKPLGIRIAREKSVGSWLEIDAMPRWEPRIAPPVRLEGEAS